ncbi:FERM, RhoGEF and pleckstrin domain-containing protein 1 [Papilio machaon]|uniref:FERM, RhoGEF and pleckstrin domain-containing protein 1 n=1 Tax=Papilio machaon TaxID=76193 RepID=A0A194RJ11_PAPMA|nr:FERM, RhoGEF and pleckstrin domain-containing protein 1 [Papilio machaon]
MCSLTEELSPEDDERTVSSASLCMSPGAESERGAAPLCSSTPFAPRLTNGYDVLDNRDRRHVDSCDTINGNVNVHIVSESTNSMDVLSGGESDAGDTLSRRNNNSISSRTAYCGETQRRRGDVTYFVAKELLMTERTYKRDLELVTVTWSRHVGRVACAGAEGAEASALARGCLALEPLALPAGALLARLDRALATAPHNRNDNEEPEYKKIADMLHDYLTNIYDAYEQYALGAGALVALVESARRRGGAGARAAAEFDATSPLPLAALLLRPLHRALHLRRLAHELSVGGCGGRARAALEVSTRMAALALQQLPHVENHSALCQVQRDITGYDKLNED